MNLPYIIPRSKFVKYLLHFNGQTIGEDLRDKSLAFQRATAQQYFVVKVLEEAGLTLSDVRHVNLTPLDTREAFIKGSVDAAVVGDPHLAIFQKTLDTRILRNAKGLKMLLSPWKSMLR